MADLGKLPQPGAPCLPMGVTDPQGKGAFTLQFGTATNEAVKTGTVAHPVNNDLTNFPDGLGSYSKGLLQASPGIVNAMAFDAFLKACGLKPGGTIGDFENAGIVLGGSAKQNGPRGAFAGQLVGKDSPGFGASIVPAAPALNSIEYAIELVELYWASLLRDIPFEDYPNDPTAQAAANELSALSAANPGKYAGPLDSNGNVTPGLLFRGGLNSNPTWFAGETVGPYLSQFCLIPTALGRLPISQQIMTYAPAQDFMITMNEWFAIQNGKAPTSGAVFDPMHRCMRCGRDTAAYTQVDELYQAYLVAFLVANTLGLPMNTKSPYNPYTPGCEKEAVRHVRRSRHRRDPGAVARAAINAVWYQKWACICGIGQRPAVASWN